jgi:hypothetical protein
MPALVTGIFFTVYGIAKFNESRDLRHLNDDERLISVDLGKIGTERLCVGTMSL